ncbi:MAG: CU044_2847 family protein [Microcystis panniformis]
MAIVKSVSKIGDEEIDIYIQVDDNFKPQDKDETLFRDSSGQRIIQATGDLFGDGLALTRNCAAKVIESVHKMSDTIKPNEFEIQLGITLDSEAGVPMLAKAGVDVQMHVTMKWKLKAE